jgi:hypothetical protein
MLRIRARDYTIYKNNLVFFNILERVIRARRLHQTNRRKLVIKLLSVVSRKKMMIRFDKI